MIDGLAGLPLKPGIRLLEARASAESIPVGGDLLDDELADEPSHALMRSGRSLATFIDNTYASIVDIRYFTSFFFSVSLLTQVCSAVWLFAAILKQT